MDAPGFEARLAAVRADVERALDAALAGVSHPVLGAAMRHAVLGGGKRLRAFLVVESARICGAPEAGALRAAAAVECLHAYSLVHDDLPCMDDDDLRRGQPTVHVRWDEATAVLVGDALQSLAFELLTDPATHADAAVRADLALTLARAAGACGMVEGQMRDIEAESATAPLTLDEVTRLQALKTGALIRWSAEAGARLAGADPAPFARYAAALGLAFQIHDDVLDVIGDAAAAGKRVGKDAARGKATFVGLLGLEGARARAAELVEEAVAALAPFGPEADGLRQAARFAISRRS
ncbi:MAG: polyprenyl synthetase family protein [Alphaproteobacteria bacterium]|nr:MAG: polyprenyl synthetase family protein [Alphaproteobacteria bacterium]